jgi:uncharacterized membrane protein
MTNSHPNAGPSAHPLPLDPNLLHKILHLARSAVTLVAGYLAIAAACILVIAALHGIITFTRALLTRGVANSLSALVRLRIEMGSLVALALQLLVAADVMETLTQVTL